MVYSELGRTYNPSDDLASEESNGLPAAPIVRNLSLAGLKDFLEQKGFKVSSFHLHYPSLCFCAPALDGAAVVLS